MAGLPPARREEEPGTAQGVALGTHGDWDSASTWPLACPKQSQGDRGLPDIRHVGLRVTRIAQIPTTAPLKPQLPESL